MIFHDLFDLIFLGVATGAISMVVSKSTLLNSFHAWVEKRSLRLEEMLSCPWCLSHWVALIFTIIYHPLVIAHQGTSLISYLLFPVDYLVNVMVMAFVAAIASRIIHSSYKPIFEEK